MSDTSFLRNCFLTPEKWIAARWPEASHRKQGILTERYQNLWGVLDEVTKEQMIPLQGKTRKPSKSKTVKTDDPNDAKVHPVDLAHIDLLTGAEFEKFIGRAFEQKGYAVEYHGGPTEAGGDLVCWEKSAERRHAILVQVKRERSLTGAAAIGQILRKESEFRSRYPHASYEKWIITSSRFSRQAQIEGEHGKVVLIDRDGLQQWLAQTSLTGLDPRSPT